MEDLSIWDKFLIIFKGLYELSKLLLFNCVLPLVYVFVGLFLFMSIFHVINALSYPDFWERFGELSLEFLRLLK